MQLCGQLFHSISAGPYFSLNPSISLTVQCEDEDELDTIWKELSPGGSQLMEVGEYPFSKKYGWIQDQFGLSWQLIYTDEPVIQKMIPFMLFVGEVDGKAERAIQFYTSIFPNSKIEKMERYAKDEEPNREGAVKVAQFEISGQKFMAMDSFYQHEFRFNEAFSFMVFCDSQEEIDYYWEKLSAVPEAEQCGWLKDSFGVSWQIVPKEMNGMLANGSKEQINRVTNAFLKMKKFDLAELRMAFRE